MEIRGIIRERRYENDILFHSMNIYIYFFFLEEKVQFIKRHLGIMSAFHPQEERELARDFVLHYLKDDGVFVTRLLSVNSSDLVVTEIINQLWTRFKTANRVYSANQGMNLNDDHHDTSILTSNPLSSNIQRPRLSRIPPPPPLPLYLPRTTTALKIDKTDNGHENIKSAKDTDV